MPLQICTNRQFCSPSAADSPTATTTGVAWTNSAYTEIAPSTDTVWVMTGVTAWTPRSSITPDDTEIDIAIGAAASEVVIATIRLRNQQGGVSLPEQFRFMIPINGLSGRHAFRVRASHTAAAVWHVALSYLKHPISGTLLISSQPTKVYPPAANAISQTTSATPWNDVTYSQIVASTATDIVLTHVIALINQAGATGEFDIAVGAAASEVIVATIRLTENSAQNHAGAYYELPNPLEIAVGSRIAFRARADSASEPATCALLYQEKPL